MLSSEAVTRTGEETERLGERLAASVLPSDVIYLIGELGAGKTTMARGLARGLGAQRREVASPTFALLHEYADSRGAIVLRHLDLYRLADDVSELAVLGLPEAVAGAPVCVEWPRGALRALLPSTVEVSIQTEADEGRRIRIQRCSDGEPVALRRR